MPLMEAWILVFTQQNSFIHNLNGLKLPRFKVSKRAVGESYALLSAKFKGKVKDKEKASGIECDLSEVEKALKEITEKDVAAKDTVESDKKKVYNNPSYSRILIGSRL